MRDDTPFPSAKAAIASVARMTQCMDYPRQLKEREPMRAQVVTQDDMSEVRRVLIQRCGLDLDSEDFELLAHWATTSDDVDDYELDELPKSLSADLLEVVARNMGVTASRVLRLCDGFVTLDELRRAAAGEGAAEQVLRKAGARRDRLARLKHDAREALREEGLIPQRRLRKISIGYVVHEYPSGRRKAMMVLDPDPKLEHVITGPNAAMVADAIVAGHRAGPVQPAVEPLHVEMKEQFLGIWNSGGFANLREFDQTLAKRLNCTERYARRIRASWGVEGSRGCKPTLPPTASEVPP